MQHSEIENFILSLDQAWLDKDLDESLSAYKYQDDKLFAVIENNSQPLKVSFKTDSQLAKTLRDRYESVVPAKNLNHKYWITVICSGQLSEQEIKDLARLSHGLVSQD